MEYYTAAKRGKLPLPTRTRHNLPNAMLRSQTKNSTCKKPNKQYMLFNSIYRKSKQAELICGDGGWGVVTLGMISTGRECERAAGL